VPSAQERTQVIDDIALAALDKVDNIDQYDLMQIAVISAYDFGLG
jgi:hypothetical protein